MKRNRLSGAAYRKIALQKAEKKASVIAQTSKISSFFKRPTLPSISSK